MTRRPSGCVSAAVVVLLALLAVACNGSDEDEPTLDGASIIGGGGSIGPTDLIGQEGEELTDLDLSEARHVVADSDGTFWIVFGVNLRGGGALVHVSDDEVDEAISLDTAAGDEPSGGYPTDYPAQGSDGEIALAQRGGAAVWVLDRDGQPVDDVRGLAAIGGVTVSGDGAIAVADQDAEVVRRPVAGGMTETVGPTGGVPVWLASLPDGSPAAVVDRAGARSLHVITANGPGPSLASGTERDGDAIGMAVGTDDERFVVTQQGERVLLVDPSERENPTVVLDGDGTGIVQSVAVVGDDLVALFDDRLWLIADAL